MTPIISNEPSWRSRLAWKWRQFWHPLWRRIPHLVWPGDEVWVQVTLTEDRLRAFEAIGEPPDRTFIRAREQLMCGAFPAIEAKFRELGIEFDKGLGTNGRDWEWDWSLKGPIQVKFKCRAEKGRKP